ncbi:MAG: hypothetical protein GY755_10020 [Chloroflexi bacterium]|nr:hypothetical protein [Chloroflexota bacterium]
MSKRILALSIILGVLAICVIGGVILFFEIANEAEVFEEMSTFDRIHAEKNYSLSDFALIQWINKIEPLFFGPNIGWGV